MRPCDAFLRLNGLLFHYRDWTGEDRPLLLLHGLASNCRIWDLTAPHLAKVARPIALDQRGHGDSAKPDDGYDFETIVSDAMAFLDALHLDAPVVVGHSWGANVALELAARYPARAAGLVLVDGGWVDVGARVTWEECAETMAPPDLTHLTLDTFLELAQKWMGDVWSTEAEAAVLANFEVGLDGRVRPRLRRDRHMRILRAFWEQRPAQLFPNVSCPVLLAPARGRARGRELKWASVQEEDVTRALALLPNARLHWFEDSFHDVPLQRPELVAEVIGEFLRGVSD